MPDETHGIAHYARFARALALVSVMGAGGCRAVPERFVCDHCRCEGAPFEIRRPVTCELIGNETCCWFTPGPRSPPDLRA